VKANWRSAARWVPAFAAGAAVGAAAWIYFLRDGTGPVRPDLVGVRRAIEGLPGSETIEPRLLGGGIVELVGEVGKREWIPPLLAAASGVEGVEVVVNRLWSPTGSPVGEERSTAGEE